MSDELRVFYVDGAAMKVRLCDSDCPFLRASRDGIKQWLVWHWKVAARYEVRREDPHIRLWVPADANVEARWREVDVLLAQEGERKQKIYKALQAPKMAEHTGPHGQRVKLPSYAPGASVATWALVPEIWSVAEGGRVRKAMQGDSVYGVHFDLEQERQISERRERTTREVQRKLREFPRCCGEPCKLDFAGNLVRWACAAEATP